MTFPLLSPTKMRVREKVYYGLHLLPFLFNILNMAPSCHQRGSEGGVTRPRGPWYNLMEPP